MNIGFVVMRFLLLAVCAVCLACDSDEFIPPTDEGMVFTIAPNPVPAVTVGFAIQLNAIGASTLQVNWTSSNPAVATVDSTGKVTGVSAGSALITARLASDPSIANAVAVTVAPSVGPPNNGGTASVSFERIIDQNGNSINASAASGFIQVIGRTDVPPSFTNGWIRLKVRGEIACVEPFLGRQQFQHRCTFDSRRFTNGPFQMILEGVQADGVVFASATSQLLVLAN